MGVEIVSIDEPKSILVIRVNTLLGIPATGWGRVLPPRLAFLSDSTVWCKVLLVVFAQIGCGFYMNAYLVVSVVTWLKRLLTLMDLPKNAFRFPCTSAAQRSKKSKPVGRSAEWLGRHLGGSYCSGWVRRHRVQRVGLPDRTP